MALHTAFSKSHQRYPSAQYGLLLLVGLAYFTYIVLRAFMIPATIDEAFTVLTYVPKSAWQVLTYDYPEPIANNHILNTLSIKLLDSIFGQNLLSTRLPNLLTGAMYVGAGIWLVRQVFSQALAQFAGLVTWLGNHYMTEFFSIGRGYGMSIGLMAVSICFAYRFFQSRRTTDLGFSLAVAWLAVAANFTVLNFFCCLSGILLLLIIQFRTEIWKRLALLFGVNGLVLALLYLPVTRMIAAKEFDKFGTNSIFEDTVVGSARSFLLGNEFFGPHTFKNIGCLVVAYFALSTALFLVKWAMERKWTTSLFLAALLPGTVAVNMAITLLTNATWLPSRTCSFLYPLLALSFFSNGQWLVSKVSGYFRLPLLAISLYLGSCFLVVANLDQSFEWWFDKHNFTVLEALKQQYIEQKRTKPISFNSSWLLSLSLKYHLLSNWGDYARYVKADFEWREGPQKGDEYEYFYSETQYLSSNLVQYDTFMVLTPGQRILLKKKDLEVPENQNQETPPTSK